MCVQLPRTFALGSLWPLPCFHFGEVWVSYLLPFVRCVSPVKRTWKSLAKGGRTVSLSVFRPPPPLRPRPFLPPLPAVALPYLTRSPPGRGSPTSFPLCTDREVHPCPLLLTSSHMSLRLLPPSFPHPHTAGSVPTVLLPATRGQPENNTGKGPHPRTCCLAAHNPIIHNNPAFTRIHPS